MGFLSRLFGRRGGGGKGGAGRGGPPARFDAAELALRLDQPLDDLREFRPGYRTFEIRKRGGGRRTISAPDERTKELQRRILRRLLARLSAHPCATGFEKGNSIVLNALPHVDKAVVVRMDLVEFFPNTREDRVRGFLRRIGWDGESADILTRLTTLGGGLPQGAPTSPRLANLVNVRLDARVAGLCASPGMGAVYTRYADDLTFSFPEEPAGRRVGVLIREVKAILAEHGYRVHHRRKLRIRRRHQQQLVTGIVVNKRANLPRRTRRWLRAVEHHLATGRAATLTRAQLAGWEAYAQMVETQRALLDEPATEVSGQFLADSPTRKELP